jgi:glycosyltransferase involved in cell wall biosynthesis
VIVGADRTWPSQDLAAVAAAHDVSSRVEVRRYVSDAELTALYARAAVFAFLSEYEGFGFTPLEALAAGVPIVVLDTPVAREVYGPAATYVRPADVEGTAAVLRRSLLTPEAAAGQLAHAPAVLARYSWDRAAADTLAALEAVARR